MTATCLRRTKDIVREELNLTRRTIQEYNVRLDQGDRELYDFFKKNASHLVAGIPSTSSGNRSTGNILPIINTLRLICNHGQRLLPKFALEVWTKRYHSGTGIAQGLARLDTARACFSCGTDLSSNDFPSEFACSHLLCTNCAESDDSRSAFLDSLVCPLCEKETQAEGDEFKGNYQPSAKVRALIENLRKEQVASAFSSDGKIAKRSVDQCNHGISVSLQCFSVVFTFWAKMLDLLEIALHQAGYRFVRIDGQKSLSQRTSALNSFRNDDNCTVMIATITSVGEG